MPFHWRRRRVFQGPNSRQSDAQDFPTRMPGRPKHFWNLSHLCKTVYEISFVASATANYNRILKILDPCDINELYVCYLSKEMLSGLLNVENDGMGQG